MYSKLATNTPFSPLGLYQYQYHHNNPKGVIIQFAPRKFRTFCALKNPNNHGIVNAENLRVGLEGLFSLAAILLNKNVIPSAAHSDTPTKQLELDSVESSHMEPVKEFGFEPRLLDRVIRVVVKRPNMKIDYYSELLVVDGVENLEDGNNVCFDVYITNAMDGMVDSDYGEFVDCISGSVELDITDLIVAMGAEGSENLVVTLVPKTGRAVIGGIRMVSKEVSGKIQMKNLFSYRNDERRKLIMINLQNEVRVSKNVSRDVNLILWLTFYGSLLYLFKDVWAELTKMVL